MGRAGRQNPQYIGVSPVTFCLKKVRHVTETTYLSNPRYPHANVEMDVFQYFEKEGLVAQPAQFRENV